MSHGKTAVHELSFFAEGALALGTRVRSLDVTEGLSRPYLVRARLEIADGGVEPRAWLMRGALVVVARADDASVVRRYDGVVTRVEERVSRQARQIVDVTIEPTVATLRLTRDRRLFLDSDVPTIVRDLLLEHGIAPNAIAGRLTRTYSKRDVLTQFDETSFDFISRLLEEEGIFYFFEHSEGGTSFVLGDSPASYGECSPRRLAFRDESGLVSDEAVIAIAPFERVRPARVTLRDHDFTRPGLDLEAAASSQAPLDRELYEYPGRYQDPDEGVRRARVRLDAETAQAAAVRIESTAFRLTSGHVFALEGSPGGAFDGDWVVRDLEARWAETPTGVDHASRAVLLSPERPFRPMLTTPRPTVPGPQIATVTGPAGSEIHTDAFGRVKVSFPWDRRSTKDDRSSAWVRVGQMHASGSVAIPRVGWEVLVDFENGDPDRPVVLGRSFNGLYVPPYSLPAQKTRTAMQSRSSPGGGGHNEIRMEDAAGSEHVHVHAQSAMVVNVANDKTEQVATSSTLGVASDHSLAVGGAESSTIAARCELTVGGPQSWMVGGTRTKSVGGDEKTSIGGSQTLLIAGSHTTKTPDAISESTPASFTETVGAAALEAAAQQVGFAVAGSASITVGGALVSTCGAGKSDFTLGAQATTIGGALVAAAGADVNTSVKGSKTTTVGGAYAATAGGDVGISSGAEVSFTVGGAVAMNGAKIVLKVGGSTVTIAGGAVVLKASDIHLTATGPHPELSGMVSDN